MAAGAEVTEPKAAEPKRRPGRPRKAAPSRLAGGERGARVTLTIDGVSVRKRVRLSTSDAAVATKKIERLQAASLDGAPAVVADSFREVAAVVFAARKARGVKRVDIELGRVDKHVFPFVGKLGGQAFGDRALSAITADEVKELLEAKRDEGYAFDQVKKIRAGMRYVFEHGKSAVMAGAPMPPFLATLKKRRAVPGDGVLLVYLGWQHPVERHRGAVRMRQAMSAFSRCIGGQRTNDLHVATWQDNLLVPETGEPDFSEVWVPRTKGQAPQLIETPEGVRPMLRLWWEQSGRPRTGPVFPLLAGERVGLARDEVQDSHALAMRQDVRRALGIEVWAPEAGTGRGPRGRWVPGRPMTPKEKPLFEEGRYTLPMDFHSWRRAWSQALARVGANVQTAAALTGHGVGGGVGEHGRYLHNPTEAAVVPAGATPDLAGVVGAAGFAGAGFPGETRTGADFAAKEGFGRIVAKTRGGPLKNMNDFECARVDSNYRPLASEGEPQNPICANAHAVVRHDDDSSDHGRRGTTAGGQNSRSKLIRPLTLTDERLWELLALATRAKRADLVVAVSAQLDAVAHLAEVTSLDARRKRGPGA